MIRTIKIGFIYIIGIVAVFSCNNDNKPPANDIPVDRERLMEMNKAMMLEEQEQIADYKKRYGYEMEVTPTGVHYKSLREGTGKQAGFRTHVTLKYKINLLDGTYVYGSDSSGVLLLTIGQSTEPSGLQEALSKMKEGGKAIVIIPSYLAYGLTGDGERITANEALVYHVELLKVEQ